MYVHKCIHTCIYIYIYIYICAEVCWDVWRLGFPGPCAEVQRPESLIIIDVLRSQGPESSIIINVLRSQGPGSSLLINILRSHGLSVLFCVPKASQVPDFSVFISLRRGFHRCSEVQMPDSPIIIDVLRSQGPES